jgi:glycosyltransferase involved in cell wall biosynthesis
MNIPKKNSILLSIIIPTYNNASYISTCIDSILCEKYSNFEVIVVDDGSIDKTETIIKKYNDHRIVYIKQANQGVSAARNAGILIAKGDYIIFADSDDLYINNGIGTIIDYLTRNNPRSKMTIFNFKTENSENGVIKNWYVNSEFIIKSTDRIFEMQKRLFSCDYYNSPFNKIYDRNLIIENEINYPLSMKNGEDCIFNIRYCAKCNDVVYLNRDLYLYRMNISEFKSNRNNNELDSLNSIADMVLYKQKIIYLTHDDLKAQEFKQLMWGCTRNQLFSHCRELKRLYKRKEICFYIKNNVVLMECVKNLKSNISGIRDFIKYIWLVIFLRI